DAEILQVALHGARAALAERHVVLLAAAFVAMALDREARPLRALLQLGRVVLERRARVRTQLRALEVEVDGLEPRHRRGRGRRRGGTDLAARDRRRGLGGTGFRSRLASDGPHQSEGCDHTGARRAREGAHGSPRVTRVARPYRPGGG